MSKQIATDTSSMSQSVSDLTVARDNAVEHLHKMNEEITTLGTMWESPAKQAFVAQFGKDFQNTEDLLTEIKDTIECMDFAKNQYNNCENQVKSIVDSISV